MIRQGIGLASVVVLAVTPDSKTLYAVRNGGGPGVPHDVLPVNTATNTAGKPINTGLVPVAITINGSHQQPMIAGTPDQRRANRSTTVPLRLHHLAW